MNLKIWQKILLLVFPPVLFEIIFVAILAALLFKTEALSDQFESSKRALLSYHDAEAAFAESMLSLASMNTSSTYDSSKEFDALLGSLHSLKENLQSSFSVRPEIKDAFADVPELFEHAAKLAVRIKEMLRTPSRDRAKVAKDLGPEAVTLVFEIKPISDRIGNSEMQMHVKAPAELSDWRSKISLVTVLGLIGSLAISIVVARIFFRNIARRLVVIEENAHRVALGKELREPLADTDEIGELDAALHKAADLILDAQKKEFAILDKSVDVLLSIDRRLRIVDIGESVLKAWHHRSDELLGRSLLTLVPPHERSRLTNLLEEASGQEKELEFETQLLGGDNLLKDILWKINNSQENKMFYCVAHDVTERRALARKKQQLISVAGHDLRTPLTSVSNNLAVIIEGGRGELSEPALKELTKASQSLERLMELVRDLLDLEKLDAGKMVLEFNSVSALDVCNVAIDSLSSLAQKFGVKIKAPWQDALMRGDERRLVQILINFLSNAIKFSPPGGTVTVSIKTEPGFIELSVADQGPGIPLEDQELVFEKFHQSKAATASAPVKSTGLGLAIAKVLAEGHNGAVGVESEVGKGSRFFMRIPAFEDDADADDLEPEL